MKRALRISALFSLMLFACRMDAQAPTGQPDSAQGLDPQSKPRLVNPLTQPAIPPGVILLMDLEGRFAADVAKGGGKAFASWFAEDGVTLNNGKAPVRGRAAIAANAVWDPKSYQLTWAPEFGQMGPSGDTGFTWGHYDARGTDKDGKPFVMSGRYITFWKRVADGSWKVALDASSNDAPLEGQCCTVPKP